MSPMLLRAGIFSRRVGAECRNHAHTHKEFGAPESTSVHESEVSRSPTGLAKILYYKGATMTLQHEKVWVLYISKYQAQR